MDAPVPPLAETEAAEPPRVLRGVLGAGLEALRTRLELAAVEFEIYMTGLVRALMWGIAAGACILLALALGVTALILSLWNAHQMVGLIGGSVLFAGLAIGLGWVAARTLARQPRFLEGSFQQLREDERQAEDGE